MKEMIERLKRKSLFIVLTKTTIMLETDYNAFVDDVIKSFMKRYNDIDKQMEGSGFSFKFVGSLSFRCVKVNEP